MVLGTRTNPYLSLNFLVEIQSLTLGGFSEVSGLEAEMEVYDYQEGGVNHYLHRLPGPAKYSSNLLLQRGVVDSDALWNWYDATVRGQIQRHNGSIILLNATQEPVKRWNFAAAYPVKWSGPELKATGVEVAVERLELAHRGISLAR